MMYKSLVQNRNKEWVNCEIDGESQVSPHLKFKEIANPSCQEDVKLMFPVEARRANACWEIVRTLYGKAMPVDCGYRSPTWNRKVGGTDNSLHLKCCAYDCQIGQITDALWANFYWWCYVAAFKYNTQAELGRYKWGLHIGFGSLDYTDKTVFTFDKRKR